MSNNNYLSLYSLPEKIDRIEKSMILCGDSLEVMKSLPEKSVDLVFTSPPYAGNFREYSEHGDPRDLGQLDTKEFVDRFIPYAKEIDRLLKHEDGGVFILNIGEKYQDGFASLYPERLMFEIIDKTNFKLIDKVPWVKCLSSDTLLYAKINESIGPVMIKDLVKRNPNEVDIWDGEKWNNVHYWGKSDKNQGVEITLENGCFVDSTDDHKFILENGNTVEAKDLKIGDNLLYAKMTNTEEFKHKFFDSGFVVVDIKKSQEKVFWTISLSEKPNRICLGNGLLVKNCDPFPNKRTRAGTLAWEHIFVFGSHPKLINKNYNYLKSPYRATSLSISTRKDFKKLRKQTKHEMNDAQCYNDIGAADRNYVVSHHNMMTFDEYKYIEEHYVVSPTQNFEGSGHKAQMPIHLAEYFIGGYSKENQVVLDPFGGSGTTAAVSWRLNRDFVHIDLIKDNCEMTEKRIQSIPKRKDLFNFYGIEENKVSKLEEVKSQTKCNKIF